MRGFCALVRIDLRIATREMSDSLAIILFLGIAACLFPLGLGPEPNMLTRIAPGILWVTALFATMLSFDRLFHADYQDGTLELLIVSPQTLWVSALAKIAAHWLTTGLPLVVVSPFIAVMLHLDPGGYGVLAATLALGTAIISLIGALGAALTLGSRRSGVLLSVLVLPLLVPVLIFGVGTVEATIQGYAVTQPFLILTAIFLICLVSCPWSCSRVLRSAID